MRDALVKVCHLLIVLQEHFMFMHGDLHGENVMCGHRCVFDRLWNGECNVWSVSFYHEWALQAGTLHSQLDLLTLLTSLRRFGLSKHKTAASWCGSFVDPFWTTVRHALVSGSNDPLPYGARRTVRTAEKEIMTSGEVYYAHHLLYEDIGNVSTRRATPKKY